MKEHGCTCGIGGLCGLLIDPPEDLEAGANQIRLCCGHIQRIFPVERLAYSTVGNVKEAIHAFPPSASASVCCAGSEANTGRSQSQSSLCSCQREQR